MTNRPSGDRKRVSSHKNVTEKEVRGEEEPKKHFAQTLARYGPYPSSGLVAVTSFIRITSQYLSSRPLRPVARFLSSAHPLLWVVRELILTLISNYKLLLDFKTISQSKTRLN